jgi:hypothetical protein
MGALISGLASGGDHPGGLTWLGEEGEESPLTPSRCSNRRRRMTPSVFIELGITQVYVGFMVCLDPSQFMNLTKELILHGAWIS